MPFPRHQPSTERDAKWHIGGTRVTRGRVEPCVVDAVRHALNVVTVQTPSDERLSIPARRRDDTDRVTRRRPDEALIPRSRPLRREHRQLSLAPPEHTQRSKKASDERRFKV